jgi:hypothetical protein
MVPRICNLSSAEEAVGQVSYRTSRSCRSILRARTSCSSQKKVLLWSTRCRICPRVRHARLLALRRPANPPH